MHYRKSLAWAGLAALLLALLAVWSPAAPAHAAARRANTADSLTLALTNGTTFPYDGGTFPIFSLNLVVGTPLSRMSADVTITLANTDTGTSQTLSTTLSSTDGTTFTGKASGSRVDNGGVIDIGAHTATATFINTAAGVTDTSNSVNFTISPIYSGLQCGVGSSGGSLSYMGIWTPGQSVMIAMQNDYTGTYPLDWTKGTVTITLKGPQTFTYANQPLDSNGATTISAPTTVGRYAMDCRVSGVPDYTFGDTGFSSPQYLVSEKHALGGVQIYTNPTTLVVNHATQMYVVFKAASGLPTPTGQFVIYVGQGSYFYYTQGITIKSDGTAYVTVGAIPNLYSANNITVHYLGDPYYNDQSVNFTLTNPAIPGSSSGGGTTPSSASGTTTPHTTATASATGTAPATAVGGASSVDGGATTTPGAAPSALGAFWPLSGGGLIALLIAIGLLVVGSGVGTFVLLSRRGAARANFGAAPMDLPPSPSSPPSGASFNDDTLPQRRIDQQWPPQQW